MHPRGSDRILYKNDPGQALEWVSYDPTVEQLHRVVDALVEHGVDIVSQDVFVAGRTAYDSAHCTHEGELPRSSYGAKYARLRETGIDPVQVAAEHCHRHGRKFIASLRMNDRHSRGIYPQLMGAFVAENPQFWLREHPGGLDYSFPEVRAWMLRIIEEIVERYDVDGIELDYLRYFYVFPSHESRRKQPILTAFMREVRRILDRHGARRGRRLWLGAWVAQTLVECHDLGLDVPIWIEEKLLDYVCPTDYDCPDYNAPYETFAELTRRTDCRLFPAAQPMPARFRYFRTLMSAASYRGLARNFYATGADGVSVYNYTYHWAQRSGLHYLGSPDNYPSALGHLLEMRDVEGLADKSRHYPFFCWRNLKSEYPAVRDRSQLYVPMSREPWKPGRGSNHVLATFRMAEACENGVGTVLRFKALGLVSEDEIRVFFNNEEVPAESIHRTYYPEGRDAGWDDDASPPTLRRDYSVCRFTPTTPPAYGIEHVLGIELSRSADVEPTYHPDGSLNQIHVTEVELGVAATSDGVDEVMAGIREQVPSPMDVPAGYHAHLLAVWREKVGLMSFGTDASTPAEGDAAEEEPIATRLAQSFVLHTRARVRMIDVLLQPDLRPILHTMFHASAEEEIARDPIMLSVHGDHDGRPDSGPIAGQSVTYVPREHADELLDTFQGYYAFQFDKPLDLEAGRYWIVLRKGEPAGAMAFTFQALMAPGKKYPDGCLLVKPGGGSAWTKREETLFFGVHENE